jgi:hypothetical protein
MSKENDGGPAYPMSLRDYFAIHAPDPSTEAVINEQRSDRLKNQYNEQHKPKIRTNLEINAALRYSFADAMLAEREKWLVGVWRRRSHEATRGW